MDTTTCDIPRDPDEQPTPLNNMSASSQHIMTLEADIPRAESAHKMKSNTISNTSTQRRVVESIERNHRPTVSNPALDNSKYHMKIETFHWRDFVFDLPAPVFADSCGDALPTYDYLTAQQKRNIQHNSDQNPKFDFFSLNVADDADVSITNHIHNARYFRHLDLLKSQIGEETVYNANDDHRKDRNPIRPGQVKVNNAFGLYEVEHWPGARDQVIWTDWTISAVQADKLDLPMPAIPNEAKNMFRFAINDSIPRAWKECWMLTQGSRLCSAIFWGLRVVTLGRNTYRPMERLLGDRDDTKWIEVEWAHSAARHNSIDFGGHDFSRTQAMRDMLVAKRGYVAARKRFELPARFGKGAKLDMSVLWKEEHLLEEDVPATLMPVAKAAPASTIDPRPVSETSQPGRQASKSVSDGKASSSKSAGQTSKRKSLQHQPARSSGLRNSIQMTSDDTSLIRRDASNSALEVRDRGPSSTGAELQQGSRSSHPASAVGGAGAQRAPAPLPPGAVAVARGTISVTTLPTSGNSLDQFVFQTQHPASTAGQTISSTEPPTTLPVTTPRQDMAPAHPSQSPTSHDPSNARSGIAGANVAAQLHPPVHAIRPQRLAVIYRRLFPQITPEQVSTELDAMQHNNHDEMGLMHTLRETRRHIALGLWSLPAWNLRSETDVDTMANRVLQGQFAGVLNDWRQNVLGLDYDAIRQRHQRPASILLVVMAHTLHQANPAPPITSLAERNFWKAAYELEARRWRMEMMQTWCRYFSSQRQLAIQTRGNFRYKQLGNGTAVNLWTSRIESLG